MTKSEKISLAKKVLLLLIGFGIIGLILTGVLFFGKPSPTRATATIQFSFDGAADGIAPNGQVFDISEMASDSVLEEALKTSGMDNRYTVEQIRPHLVIKGSYPDDMASQVMNYESLLSFTASRELTVGDFHPTSFGISLYNTFDKSISKSDLTGLLSRIIDTYKAYFARAYGYHLDESTLHLDIENYDYPQQLDIFQTQMETVRQYAQELQDKYPSFRYNGYGFGDIKVQMNNLVDNDLGRMNAELNMNGLTRDTERMLVQYQYEVKDLMNKVEKQQVQLANVDKLISTYEKNEIIYLSTSDSLTKIDGNSSETYDFLVDQRKVLADGITDLKSEIDSYQLKMADLLKMDAPELLNNKTDMPAESTGNSAAAVESVADTQDEAGVNTDAQTMIDKMPGNDEEESAETGELDTEESDIMADNTLEEPAETAASSEHINAEELSISTMSEEEIAQAAKEAEELAKRRIAVLENNISDVLKKREKIVADFKQMLQAYNDQEINDLTVNDYNYDYFAPSVFSGAFIKAFIMTGGPICTIGFMLAMILIIVTLKKAEKKREQVV